MINSGMITLRLLVMSYIVAKRQLIHNRTAQRDAWNQSYDFIVVGGGTAGCVVASRLAEDRSIMVLLLEAGGAEDAIWTDLVWFPAVFQQHRPDIEWHYYDEPLITAGGMFPGGRINEFMGKIIGGSSSHNGVVYNRGNRRSFDNWVKSYGAVGWSYREVMPYFLKWENNTDPILVNEYPKYHATSGPVQVSTQTNRPRALQLFESAYNSIGYQYTDLNGPNQTGVTYPQFFVDPRGFRVSSGLAYVDPNPYPTNLHIVTRAQVLRVIFNGTTAVGVEFNRNDTSYTVMSKKEIILSAGTYNTPQILMLSGVGPKENLQQFNIPVRMELPVGNNLVNQPLVVIVTPIIDPSYRRTPPQLTLDQLQERYRNNSGPLGTNPILVLMYSTFDRNDPDYPNIYQLTQFSPDGQSLITVVNLVIVKSRGTVRLQSSSPYIAPRIDPNYYSDPRDLSEMVEALKMIFYILETRSFNISQQLILPTFESIDCPSCPGKYMYQCNEGLRCYLSYWTASSYHPGGTCRMGDPNRDDVVVDPQLRVKNMNKLRVCDASIFPDDPNANPTAAVLMVGEKCAQIIKDCYHLS